MSEIRFTVPLPPPALRLNHRAQHWGARAKAADEYSAKVHTAWWQSGEVRFRTVTGTDGSSRPISVRSASVEYTWRYAGKRPDIDNIAASIKVLQDTLGCAPANGKAGRDRWFLGIVADDGDLEPVTFRREKVARRADEGVSIVIRRVE